MRLEVTKTMERLCAKYYVSTPQGVAVSPIITAYNLGATFSGGALPNLPNLPGKITFLDKAKYNVHACQDTKFNFLVMNSFREFYAAA